VFQGDLAPISCKGQNFELIKIPLVTLIDSLDSLVVMGNYSEFRKAILKVESVLMNKKFDYDINVSVFETTIRILGGLLSAHLLAIDESLEIYVSIYFLYWIWWLR
jgi:mannosidase alpha-like ER degradation enhancer 2